VETPLAGQAVDGALEVSGWAFKDGVGLSRVELLLDGRSAGDARYGRAFDVRPFWKISNDPQHPNTGFDARLDISGLKPGTHWLGLRLHGNDGSVETWAEQPFEIK